VDALPELLPVHTLGDAVCGADIVLWGIPCLK
jgi:hypothetical protein